MATKVKIIKANMQSYWYAGKLDEEFWVSNHFTTNDYGRDGWKVVDHTGGRWIDFDDCKVIKTGKIKVTILLEELE